MYFSEMRAQNLKQEEGNTRQGWKTYEGKKQQGEQTGFDLE